MGSVTRKVRPRKNPNQVDLPLDSGPAWVVYVLCDPRVDDPVQRIRYVGFSTRPKNRLQNHISESKRGKKTHKCRWINQLIANGLEPVMEIIDPGSSCREWGRNEQAWIKHFRDMGCHLTNGTDGGDGFINLSQESREKRAESIRNRIVSPETRAKLSEASRRRMADPEVKKRLIEAHLGHKHTEESRAKMSASKKGKPKSKEHIAKMIKANTGRIHSQEARSRMSEAAKKRMSDPAARARLSEATKRQMSDLASKAIIAESNRRRATNRQTAEQHPMEPCR